MGATSRRKRNELLRRQRLLRGWSLQQVVDRLCSLCEEEEDVPGVTADMVSKWERGERKPSRYYQTKLCLLYNTTADRLGFFENQEMVPSPDVDIPQQVLTPLSKLPGSFFNTQTIDTPANQEQRGAREALASQLLSLSSRQLASLTTLGWTQQEIVQALQVVLQGETAMAHINRRQIIQLGTSMLLFGGTDFTPEEHPSAEQRTALSQHIGESIVAGWTLFHTAGTDQVLAVSQSQLTLIQEAHSMLYSNMLPFLYSGAYRLRGAALFFQQRYREAFSAHDRGYLAAIESRDPWNIAESLSWKAYIYQEWGEYAQAIETIQEALRVIKNRFDQASLRLKAHLLACWAENAAKLREYSIATEKLEKSEALLEHIAPNEEFDRTKWLQQAGRCALISGNYTNAASYFQDALDALPHHWTLRHAITLVPLAMTYARMGERDKSLAIAGKAVSALTAMNARLLLKQFEQYLQHDLLEAYPDDSQVQAFLTQTRQLLPQLSC